MKERIDDGITVLRGHEVFKAFKIYDCGLALIKRATDAGTQLDSLGSEVEVIGKWLEDLRLKCHHIGEVEELRCVSFVIYIYKRCYQVFPKCIICI